MFNFYISSMPLARCEARLAWLLSKQSTYESFGGVSKLVP